MPIFSYKFQVQASLKEVSDFHHDASVLRKLSPPPIFVQMHEVEPLGENSVADFTLWLGPLPIRWVAVHTNVGPGGFTDTQKKGWMKSWRHTHKFTQIENNLTQIHDHIEYFHQDNFKGLITRLLFSRPALWFLFTYRRFIITRTLRNKNRGSLTQSS